MAGYVTDIEKATEDNESFRRVLFTSGKSQLVVMTLLPGEEVGMETHDNVDQFIRFEKGEGKAILDGSEYSIEEDWAVVIPAGVTHNIINTSDSKPMKFYTVYSPPEHADGTIHRTKAEADAAELTHQSR